ncbi:MAG: UDP-glucose 4-epimerase GalE [Clostridia bacterium]|nr:UDP-glucose 4-epimerase GalE [Clostridia bacterium]
MSILITGGAGFIGSHTAVEFLEAGYDIVVVDNYYNSSPKALDRIKEITGKDFRAYEVDLCDKAALEKVFVENPDIDSAIHFAGLKAVGESVQKPGMYYYNNLVSTLNLVEMLSKYNAKRIVFSSSATVYGMPKTVPIREDFPLSTTNPYGETKLMIERILKDVWVSDNEWSVSVLRYFNPIGAHKSGLIGENPKGIPNNLLPYVAKVAAGQLPCLSVFGDDYDTKDGTGVRDYIHVVDLAKAHLKALERAEKVNGVEYFNVGTGTGYSVLEIVKAYEKATGLKVNYKIVDRRPGDIATCYADPKKAYEVLGWRAENDIDDMCRDLANWMKKNPNGYEGE